MKLTQQLNSKVAPDDAIRDYKLPSDKKESRQMLTDTGLCLKIKKLHKKNTTHVEYRKDFYYSKNGKLVKYLGSFGDMTYKEALKALDEFLLAVPSAAKTSKNTLRSVFESYLTFRPLLAATTVKKRELFFQKGLECLPIEIFQKSKENIYKTSPMKFFAKNSTLVLTIIASLFINFGVLLESEAF